MRVCADAKPNELTSAFSLSLTRHIILLKTGNVFAFSTCSWRLGCVSTGGFDAVVRNRSFPRQKISKMLRLARNQCGSAIYLVGSIHALDKNDYPLPSPYEVALRNSTRFVF